MYLCCHLHIFAGINAELTNDTSLNACDVIIIKTFKYIDPNILVSKHAY